MTATAASAMRVPKRISPDPILEAVAEIRFQPEPVAEAVFGIVYSLFQRDYPSVEKLPILQLPDEIRENDPDLMFKPHYRLEGPPFTLQVGPRVISLTVTPYSGWTNFSQQMLEMFAKVNNQHVFSYVMRLGLRYVNFFDGNVLPQSTVKVEFAGESLADSGIFLRTQVHMPPHTTTIHVATHASVGEPPARRNGTAIDLDTFVASPQQEITDENFPELLTGAHDELKLRFFSLLKPEFIATLNPEYD